MGARGGSQEGNLEEGTRMSTLRQARAWDTKVTREIRIWWAASKGVKESDAVTRLSEEWGKKREATSCHSSNFALTNFLKQEVVELKKGREKKVVLLKKKKKSIGFMTLCSVEENRKPGFVRNKEGSWERDRSQREEWPESGPINCYYQKMNWG